MQILTFQTARSLKELIKDTPGAVTFIECRIQPELAGLIQIDATTNFSSHVAVLQKNNPFLLYFRGYIATADTQKTLQQVHEQLGKFIFRLPWFLPSYEVTEFINKNAQPPPKTIIPASALTPQENLITIEEVAKKLNVSVPTVRRLEQNGKIPSIRTGRLIRFNLQHVLDALNGVQNKK